MSIGRSDQIPDRGGVQVATKHRDVRTREQQWDALWSAACRVSARVDRHDEHVRNGAGVEELRLDLSVLLEHARKLRDVVEALS